MKHLGTKYLETNRLILRPFSLDDTAAMFKNWASDEEVTKYLTWPPHRNMNTTQKVLKSWIHNYTKEDYYQWAIVLKENHDEPIGSIGVNAYNHSIDIAQIGYCIGKQWWHKGITTEALMCIMNFLFHEVGVKRIEATHDVNNPNSGSVMKKCGMKYEGTLRQAGINNQGIHDVCYYAKLSTD